MIAFSHSENGDESADENGRDSHGRFCVGNKGGPGRPHKRSVKDLVEAAERCLEAAKRAAISRQPGWRAVCREAAEFAREVASKLNGGGDV